MKKIILSLVALIISAVMVFSLAGCNNKTESEGAAGSTTPEVAVDAESESATNA